MLVWTSDREELIRNIASHLHDILGEEPTIEIMEYNEFPNGECKLQNDESLRGKHVYAISDVNNNIATSSWHTPSLNDKLAFTRYQLYNAQEHGAKTINALFTMFPYSRADQKEAEWNKDRSLRRPTSLGLELNILQMMWIDQLMTLDMHNRSSTSALDKAKITFTDLPTWWFIQDVLKKMNVSLENTSIFSTDEWWAKKIPKIAKDFWMKYGLNAKIKDTSAEEADAVGESYILWEVTWRHILLFDDMGDTMWTVVKTVENMIKSNPASIDIALTHFLWNWPALERLKKLHDDGLIRKAYTTNSVKHDDLPNFVEVIDSDLFFAEKIATVAKGWSLHYNKNTLSTHATHENNS